MSRPKFSAPTATAGVAADVALSGEPRARHAAQRSVQRRWEALPWLLPSILLLVGVVAYPIVVSVQSAFTRYTDFGYTDGFAGLRNFAALFTEPALPHVLWNTVRWVVCVVAGTLAISMALAQLLNARFRGRRVLRWTLIVPWAASLVITSVVWRYIYDRNYGYLNRILLDLHVIKEPVSWTVSPAWTPWALIVIGIMVSVPFTTFVLLAGLQSLDPDVYEAAHLDGAGPVQEYLRVTLPLLRPAITITLVLNTIYVLNSFPIIWVLTGNQPGYANDTLITFMYKIAFRTNLDLGEAAALSLVVVALTLVPALTMVGLTGHSSGAEAWHRLLSLRRTAPAVRGYLLRWNPDAPRRWRTARVWALPVLATVVALGFLAPYAVMFLSSLKSDRDLFASPARYLPSQWKWHNWVQTFSTGDLPTYFRNSIIISLVGTAIVLVVATPAAYYTARFAHRGRALFLNIVLITQMFAPVALVVGIAREWQQLGLDDSLIAVILTDAGFSLAFAIWMLRSTFAAMPAEIEEAGRLDGLGQFRSLLKLGLPLARPGMVTAAIFTFIAIWNEYVAALTITSTPRSQPLTVGLTSFIGQYQVHYQYLFAASLVAVLPVVALFVIIERHLVGGLTAGAVK